MNIGGSCKTCACAISHRNLSGLCRSCAAKARTPATNRRTQRRVGQCLDCGTGITAQSKGRCRPCATKHFNRCPETIAKRLAGWKRRMAKPGEYEKLCAQAKINSRRAMADPIKRQQAVERGMDIYRRYLNTPESRAKVAAGRKQAGRKISERLLAWCPPEYRELHRANVESHKMKAAESRQFIQEMIREAKRSMTFEEKLKLVAEGKLGIVNSFRPASNDHEFTLGGVSSGWAA